MSPRILVALLSLLPCVLFIISRLIYLLLVLYQRWTSVFSSQFFALPLFYIFAFLCSRYPYLRLALVLVAWRFSFPFALS